MSFNIGSIHCGQWIRFYPTDIKLMQSGISKSEYIKNDSFSHHWVINGIDKKKKFIRFLDDEPEYLTVDLHVGVVASDNQDFSHQYKIEFSYDNTIYSVSHLDHHISVHIVLSEKNMSSFITSIIGLKLDYISLKIPFLKTEFDQHLTDNYEMIDDVFQDKKFRHEEAYSEGFIFNFHKDL